MMLDCIANDEGAGWMIINLETSTKVATGPTSKCAWMAAADSLQNTLDEIRVLVSPHPSGEGE